MKGWLHTPQISRTRTLPSDTILWEDSYLYAGDSVRVFKDLVTSPRYFKVNLIIKTTKTETTFIKQGFIFLITVQITKVKKSRKKQIIPKFAEFIM